MQRRAYRPLPFLLPLLSWVSLAAVPATAAGPGQAPASPAILTVEPARHDTLLVCRLRTRGLPDARSRETIASGLPSALVCSLELQDAAGAALGVTRLHLRIEPDLLGEAFLLRTPLVDLRAHSLDELADLLADLGPLPVIPFRELDGRRIIRLRARLAIHPLAPAEIERVHELFGSQRAGEPAGRQELSIGLGSLVRRLLGKESGEDWVSTQASAAFRADTLGAAR